MPEAVRVTVLLANEDTLHRDGLCAVLGANAELDVVLACDNGYVALDEIRRLRPEVAVVDLNLDGLAGIDVVRRVRAERLSTKIIILSATVDDDTVRDAMLSGADGYVLKDGPARHLTDAIFYVRDGGRDLSPTLTTESALRRARRLVVLVRFPIGGNLSKGAGPRRSVLRKLLLRVIARQRVWGSSSMRR